MTDSKYDWRVLDRCVLVVAKANPGVGDWAAYVGSIPGKDHLREYDEVARHGSKVPRWMAERLFPGFAAQYQWRD